MRDNSALHQEIAELRQQVDYLSAQLADRDRDRASVPVEQISRMMLKSKLTSGECRMLISMSRGLIHTRQMIMPFTRTNDESEYGERAADCLVKRTRKKLPWLKITTLYGVGYSVDGKGLTDLRTFINGEH